MVTPPATSETRDLGDSLATLVAQRESPLIKVTEVTAWRAPSRSRRRAFRLDFADGTTLKGRRLVSEEKAERVVSMLAVAGAALPGNFPRVIAQCGDALLLEWIEGTPLNALRDVSTETLRRAGALLGALHLVSGEAAERGRPTTMDDLRERRQRAADALVHSGALAATRAERALQAAAANAPTSPPEGLIHKDFCGANLVTTPSGRLACIDNPSLGIGPLDLDLGRSWYRWNLDTESWRSFEEGYGCHRSPEEFRRHAAFWKAHVLLVAAERRQRRGDTSVDGILARLDGVLSGAAAPPTRTRLGYGRLEVVADAPDAADIEWIESFLGCGFEAGHRVAGRDPEAVAVTLHIDPETYERLQREPPPSGTQPVEAFAGDGKRFLFEPQAPQGGMTVHRWVDKPVFVLISPDGRRVVVLVRERLRRGRVAWMRVVRELAMGHAIATGGALVHGAALRTPAGVIVISGPRRSGKTTLLLSLLGQPDVEYLANDRCFLHLADAGETAAGATIRGMPTIVSLRPGTLALFGDLAERVTALRRARDLPSDGDTPGPKFGVDPHELCRLMGVGSSGQGTLRAFLFPRVVADAAEPRLVRLAPQDAAAHLRAGLFRAGHERLPAEVFVPDALRGDPAGGWAGAERVIPVVARECLCFSLELTDGTRPDDDACRQLLEELSAPGGASAPKGASA